MSLVDTADSKIGKSSFLVHAATTTWQKEVETWGRLVSETKQASDCKSPSGMTEVEVETISCNNGPRLFASVTRVGFPGETAKRSTKVWRWECADARERSMAINTGWQILW